MCIRDRLPDFRPSLASEERALLERDAADGNEGDDVGSADAGMDALLGCEVDELGCAACSANGRFDDGGRRTGDGDYGAVVIGIERPVEEAHALYLHGGDDRLDHLGPPAFGVIRHAFDEGVGHAASVPAN